MPANRLISVCLASFAVGALALTGCSTGPTAISTTATPSASRPQASSAPAAADISFQLRPVITMGAGNTSICPPSSITKPDPAQAFLTCSSDNKTRYATGPAFETAAQVREALAMKSEEPDFGGGWVVAVSFDHAGATALTTATTAIAKQPSPRNHFAYVVNGVVIAAPTVQEPISGGEALIPGLTQSEAQKLADALNAA